MSTRQERSIKDEADNRGKEEAVVRMERRLLVTAINISELIDIRIDWHLDYPSHTLPPTEIRGLAFLSVLPKVNEDIA